MGSWGPERGHDLQDPRHMIVGQEMLLLMDVVSGGQPEHRGLGGLGAGMWALLQLGWWKLPEPEQPLPQPQGEGGTCCQGWAVGRGFLAISGVRASWFRQASCVG